MLKTPDPAQMRKGHNDLTQSTKWELLGVPAVVWTLEQFWHTTHNTFSLLVMENAHQIPYDHPAQVKLVRLLSHLTPRADDAGHFWHNYHCCPIPVQRALQASWQTDYFRDLHDEICQFQLDSGVPLPSEVEAEISRHVNFHSFAAYMGQFKILDMTLMALIAMRDCFEGDWDDPQVQDPGGVLQALQYDTKLGVPADEARIKLRSSMISAASKWVLVNGSDLFTEMVQFPREVSSELLHDKYFVTGPLHEGPLVGIERWLFWREGFENVARGKGGLVDEKCAQLATKAAKRMTMLEEIMWH